MNGLPLDRRTPWALSKEFFNGAALMVDYAREASLDSFML
jgi:hypothetical protein